MDKLGVNHGKAPKQQPRTKKNTIKVVHFSNPMKVETSASKFRALVQELTGQDSDYPVDFAKFLEKDGAAGDLPSLPSNGAGEVDHEPYSVMPVDSIEPDRKLSSTVNYPLAFLEDDVFTPKMIENFTGFFPS